MQSISFPRRLERHLTWLLVSAGIALAVARTTLSNLQWQASNPYYGALLDAAPRQVLQSILQYPVVLLGMVLRLTVPTVFVLYFVVYMTVAGWLFANFLSAYLRIVTQQERGALDSVVLPVLGAALYITFPYVIAGDNFPQAFALRTLLPGYLLTFALYVEQRDVARLLSWAAVGGLGALIDIRFFLIVTIVGFPALAIPGLLRGTARERVSFASIYGIHLMIAAALTVPIILNDAIAFWGVGAGSSSSIPVPFVEEAIVIPYQSATAEGALRGLDFLGTSLAWSPFFDAHSLGPFLRVSALLVPILAFSLSLAFGLTHGPVVRVHVASLFGFWVALFFLFTSVFTPAPPILDVLWFLHGRGDSSLLDRSLLFFRTTRFFSLLTAATYAILLPLGVGLLREHLARLSNGQGFLPLKRHLQKPASAVLTLLIVLGMFGLSAPAFVEGETFQPSQELDRHASLASHLGSDSFLSLRTSSFDVNGLAWAFPEHRASEAHSVLHFYLDYLFGKHGVTASHPEDLERMLAPWAFSQLIVDGRRPPYADLPASLESVFGGPVLAEDEFQVFQTRQQGPFTTSPGPVRVFGGLEAYRSFSRSIWEKDGHQVAPAFFNDGPQLLTEVDGLVSRNVVASYTSRLSVLAAELLDVENGVRIAPASLARTHSPANTWSPGFVSDTHHGEWNRYATSLPNYAWQYGYEPQTGFVFTWGLNSELSVPVHLRMGMDYQLLARVLTGPQQGSLGFEFLEQRVVADTSRSSNRTAFQWLEIGEIRDAPATLEIGISNLGGFNAVNIMLAIPLDDYQIILASGGSSRDYTYVVDPADVVQEFANRSFSFSVVKEDALALSFNAPLAESDNVRVYLDDQRVPVEFAVDGNWTRVELGRLLAGTHHVRLEGINANRVLPNRFVVSGAADPCCPDEPDLVSTQSLRDLHAKSTREYRFEVATDYPVSLVLPQIYSGFWRVSILGCSAQGAIFPAFYVFLGVTVTPDEIGRCVGEVIIENTSKTVLLILSSMSLIASLFLMVVPTLVPYFNRIRRLVRSRLL